MQELGVAVITAVSIVAAQWVATMPARRKAMSAMEDARIAAAVARDEASNAHAQAATANRIVQGNGKGDVSQMLSSALVLLGRIEAKVEAHAELPAGRAHPKP